VPGDGEIQYASRASPHQIPTGFEPKAARLRPGERIDVELPVLVAGAARTGVSGDNDLRRVAGCSGEVDVAPASVVRVRDVIRRARSGRQYSGQLPIVDDQADGPRGGTGAGEARELPDDICLQDMSSIPHVLVQLLVFGLIRANGERAIRAVLQPSQQSDVARPRQPERIGHSKSQPLPEP